MRGRICGTGSYLPEKYYDNNDDCEDCCEPVMPWFANGPGLSRKTHCIRRRDHGEYGCGGRKTGP